uniref:Uncharacterized protein n=1 Tax=Meloidogyne enterolobii TaxID=390850 RepID=A0A6V7W4X0_MELEN|nr:unnamed protein product [Meloidogyne enterolobii]
MKNSKRKKLDDCDETSLQNEFTKLQEAYKFVERREVTVKNVDDLKQLGAIYSSQMLNCSKRSDPFPEFNESEEESSRRSKRPRLLKLPSDGSIFIDGIPFHHFALTQLKDRHINRLKANGIEIKERQFSKAENKQISENWRSFAAAHEIPEDEAHIYMSAATATETPEKHRERINFTNQTFLRPWLCSKLLNRTAIQVFRRCYHIFRVSSFDGEDLRKWTPEDDRRLLELYKEVGNCWEYIGNELMHPRYACYLRYYKLIGKENSDGNCESSSEWSKVEIARLYNYLADHLTRNPVLVAILPKYANLDENVNWDDKEINLPSRSPSQIKEKWEKLKNEFRAVKERTQAETIREILREVILEDTCLLSKAKIYKTKGKGNKDFDSPEQLSEFILILKDFLEKQQIDKIRNIDGEQIKEKFDEEEKPFRIPVKKFLRCARYLQFIGRRLGLFKMLPLEQDLICVRLELIAFILKKIDKFIVKKKVLRKYTKRFLRKKGWGIREQLVFVDRNLENYEDYEEPIGKLLNILSLNKVRSVENKHSKNFKN